jgi:hypothetical protein
VSTSNSPITREVFRHMPFLLSRAEFLEVTGLGESDLTALVRSGGVHPWYPPGKGTERKKGKRVKGERVGGYAKYLKVEAARIAGVEEWLK